MNDRIELAIVKGATSGVAALTDTHLILADDTTYEQWFEGLKAIKWYKDKLAIGFADYLAWGRNKFGPEKVDVAIEQLEFELSYVKAADLINMMPEEMRYSNLTGDHYVELAKSDLPAKKKLQWARVASEQDLSPSQLKLSMIEGEVVDRAVARQLNSGIITVQGIRGEFDMWVRRVGGLEGILAMEHASRLEILGELQPIVELAQGLRETVEEPIEAEQVNL